MELIKPSAINFGDTIGIVAPSMFIFDETSYQRGVECIKNIGFKVKEGNSLHLKTGYTAGSDQQRADDLMMMFCDPSIKAIISLVGGSSTNRILDLLDYATIETHPKIFSGLSDITNLHLALLSCSNIVTLHHLDVIFGFGGEQDHPAIKYGIELFKRVTMSTTPLGKIPAYGNWRVWREGRAEGRLVGGWLPALGYLAGSKYWPKFNDSLLFWEAADLQIHTIDKILTNLRLSGVFDSVKGMLIGKTPGCEEKEYADFAPSLRELVIEITAPYGFPILTDLDFGHVEENMPLPEGILARMETQKPSLTLLESAVI